MPELERELDERSRLQLPKELFEKWGSTIMIAPNSFSAIIYPKNVKLEDIIKSTEILLQDLQHRVEVENERKRVKK